MNSYWSVWECIMIFIFFLKDCRLHPALQAQFNGLGTLTVTPATPFLLGSDLTVHCHIRECRKGSKIFIELQNNGISATLERVNCTTAVLHLFNVRTPQSAVLCKLEFGKTLRNVNGLTLKGGIPPDKPGNIICVTTKSSDSIGCSWFKGQETYIPTANNISIKRLYYLTTPLLFSRENGSLLRQFQIQGTTEVTLPRVWFDENTTYQINITAYNPFGASPSDPFPLCVKDIVIPETPHIMQVEFVNYSLAALLHWSTAESSERLSPCVRLRTFNTSWRAAEGTKLREDQIEVGGLEPLTDYEFQVRACFPLSGEKQVFKLCFTSSSASNKRSYCSNWSPTVKGKSPGKGPSQKLHVWRVLGNTETNGLKMVTALWKPPSPKDYSGEVQHYIIFSGEEKRKNTTCVAAVSQCLVQVPADVQTLSISVVTLYGTSPPADMPLKQSGDHGPDLYVTPAADGSAVFVSWSWAEGKHWSASGEKLLRCVLEWKSIPAAEQEWQSLGPDENTASVTGLTAGVRYNISLFAVTTRGVSAPSSHLVYSHELKPQAGPSMSVLVRKDRQIQVQWDELPVEQQRGFIKNYTIYVQSLDSRNTELRVPVSDPKPRQMWLDCPDGALALQMTASTSAGEGPRGIRVPSLPAEPGVSLVIVMVFIITFFVGILSNLLCWSCVRESIKEKCVSWGPACVGENLPKPENSFAIRLLKHNRDELSFSTTISDPPLSLILQDERDDVYPCVHIESYQTRRGQFTVDTPLLISDFKALHVDSQVEPVSYKPQTALQEEESKKTDEEQSDMLTSGQEERCLGLPGGLLGGLLSTVEVDFSASPLGQTLSSVSDLLWPEPTETITDLKEGYLPEKEMELDCPCQDFQQGEIIICDPADTCVSGAETSLTDGYFPQVADVSTVHCDTLM
ncbi:interleukin-23 receptor [Halichoeres trimaculatus]|uniref:interleukin-23 receptor n=1 Tax=Halichoeres trimaculatus TaxID=147232 RepID=UPI003D9F0686